MRPSRIEALEAGQIISTEEQELTRAEEDSSVKGETAESNKGLLVVLSFYHVHFFCLIHCTRNMKRLLRYYDTISRGFDGRDVVGGGALQDKLSGWLFRDWWSSIFALSCKTTEF